MLALSLASAGAAAANWAIQSVPPVPSGLFGAVSCSTSTACTAVGGTLNNGGPTTAVSEGWNGVGWSLEATPNPAGQTIAFLDGVSCTSPVDCIAVGYSDAVFGTSVTVAEHWNGVSWSIEPTPNAAGATSSALNGVSCPSPGECMAVGFSTDGAGNNATLAERWNGVRWSIEPTPGAAGATSNVLSGVSCASKSYCTAVGFSTSSVGRETTLGERWSGHHWSLEVTPSHPGGASDALLGVSCTHPNTCTAVGHSINDAGTQGRALAERQHGGAWSIQATAPLPAGADGVLQSVSCRSSGRCTAVGYTTDSSGAQLTLAERLHHGTWNVQTTANPVGEINDDLLGVSCTAIRVCTAVGYGVNGTGSVLLAERS
jgi:hypothetical protein